VKILIIGSEGFIGSYLIQQLTDENIVGCDLFEAPSSSFKYDYLKVSRLSPQWDEIFTNHKFDVCINAAGSGNVPYSMQHPLIDFESNTLDVIRLLEAIRKHNNGCKYLHISSAAVYGNPSRLPVSEDSMGKPLSPYGWHKLMSEQICAEYFSLYKIPIAIVRPFSVYGERLKKQLLWDICSRLKDADSIQLFGTGTESRDFIHVEDLARLIDLLIQKAPFEGEVYNAASGVERTICSIAEIFEKDYDGKKKISFSGEITQGDPLHWRTDISSVSSFGFKPEVSFEGGVADYIQWFTKTYPSA